MTDLNKHTVKQLRSMAKDMGLVKYSRLRKAELITAIQASAQQIQIANDKVIEVKHWLSQIIGRSDNGGLQAKIIASGHTRAKASVRSGVQFNVGTAKEGDLFEWQLQSSEGTTEIGYMYFKKGELVPVPREFVELLV